MARKMQKNQHTPARIGFQDIRETVLRRIQDRHWAPGALLPTEHELAGEFGCARATVNRALRELAEEGIIDRKRKSGTRVAVDPVKQATFEIAIVRRQVEGMNAAYRYSRISRTLCKSPHWLAARLGIPAGGHVMHVMAMHYADNRPYQHEDRWINIAAVPDVTDQDFTTTGPNEWLLDQVPFTDAEIGLAAIPADQNLADFMDCAPATPLLQMERITWLRKTPVTFVTLTFHAGYRMQTRY